MTLPPSFLDAARAALGDASVVNEAADRRRYEVAFWHDRAGIAAVVLRPGSTAEVQAAVRLCADAGVGIVPQAGNTGLVGGGIPDASGQLAVLSLERMTRIRHVDPTGDHLVAEAGCVLADVQAAADAAGRLFPLSLGAEGSCRIGGNVATNAGGVNVLRYGMTRDLVLGLEVVLADGSLWDGLRALRKDNRGYDLKHLFIGSEGTLGIVTAATLRLVARPKERLTAWLGVADVEAAVALFETSRGRVGELATSFEAIAGTGVHMAQAQLEGVRAPLVGRHGWYVLAEFAWGLERGLGEAVEAWLGDALERGLVQDGTIASSGEQRATMWRIREGQSEAAARLGAVWRSDVAVAPGDVATLVRRAEAALVELVPDAVIFPFGHLGDGNLHVNLLLPGRERIPADLAAALQSALFDVVDALGGSFSAEHGIGRSKRAELLARKPAIEIELMRKLKGALDPHGLLNPGAVI